MERKWEVPGVASPHDLALTAAPLEITGPGERALAVYISETAPAGSTLRKFILLPEGAAADCRGCVRQIFSTESFRCRSRNVCFLPHP